MEILVFCEEVKMMVAYCCGADDWGSVEREREGDVPFCIRALSGLTGKAEPLLCAPAQMSIVFGWWGGVN